MLGALVLAAGRSRRFGSDKRRAELPDGVPLLERTVSRYLGIVEEIVVVLRPDDAPAVLLTAGTRARVRIVHSRASVRGMGASLADGIRQCGGWPAAMIVLGDMPWIERRTVRLLVDRWHGESDAPARILRPTLNGRPGHPVVFARSFFQAIAELDGDTGAADLVRRADHVEPLPVGDPGVVADVDVRGAVSAPPGRAGTEENET